MSNTPDVPLPRPAGQDAVPSLPTPAEIRKMFNSIGWYYKRTNALDIPDDLLQKLPRSLADLCRMYTN